MQVVRQSTVEGYIDWLRRDPTEVMALFRDLLINVTEFFRDAEAFSALRGAGHPRALRRSGADETISVWVPGCATGEEVYSLGILIREGMDRRPRFRASKSLRPTSTKPHLASRAPDATRSSCFARSAPSAEAVLRAGRQQLGRPQRGARSLCVLAAQRHQRSAVLADGLYLLPQPSDLSWPRAAGSGDPHIPLRAEAGRLSVSRHVRGHQPAQRPFHAIDKKHRIFQSRGQGSGRRSLPIAIEAAVRGRRRLDEPALS